MSSGLSTPIFALIKKDNFWSCPTRDFRAKLSPKIGDFEFGWISLRDRVGFSNCLDLRMHYFVAVSASNFHVLIYSSWRDSALRSNIRFLAGPARTGLGRTAVAVVAFYLSFFFKINAKPLLGGLLFAPWAIRFLPSGARATVSPVSRRSRPVIWECAWKMLKWAAAIGGAVETSRGQWHGRNQIVGNAETSAGLQHVVVEKGETPAIVKREHNDLRKRRETTIEWV